MPIAAAAYRASVHQATGYSPNSLMLNREVYAPIDLVARLPSGDPEHYESADNFVVQQQRMTRDVYASVQEHLQVAESRRKRNYDIRVKDRDFQPGMWVWYYYPRRYPRNPTSGRRPTSDHTKSFRCCRRQNRAAKVQEEFTVRRALRQAQGLPWHGAS